MKNRNEKGFSLVELLVVVIIIAIVAAIAIPNLLASRRAANEASAISSLRTIHSAEITYFSTTGGNTTYTTIATLGAGNLIDPTLTSLTKSGYNFASSITSSGGGYCASATPSTAGTTGVRVFGVNDTGVLYQIPAAGSCATGALSTTGATAL